MKPLILILAGVAIASSAMAAPPVARPLSPAKPAGPDFAGYPVTIACPDTALIGVPDQYVKPGWSATAQDAAFKEAQVGVFLGEQMLICRYSLKSFPASYATDLRHVVPLNSCVMGPGRGEFRCKAGTPQ